MNKKTVIAVVGPTASGKTSLSIEIAKLFSGEIVSADSMQVYRHMDIATAKPTEEEMDGIPHHLIDFLEVGSEFSVAEYKDLAIEKIEEIFSRGNQPIIVGGTGFYVDTLVNNTIFFDFEKDDIRKNLQDRLQKEGIENLYEELKEVDKESYDSLHVNDEKRILRALEVYYGSGKTITEQRLESHKIKSEYDWIIIGLTSDNRQYLYDRINRRVDFMLEAGLLEEAKNFYSLSPVGTAVAAIGYKELLPYLNGELSLEEAVENLKRGTRRYAKRQLTWFKRNGDIHWIDIFNKDKNEILAEAVDILGECDDFKKR